MSPFRPATNGCLKHNQINIRVLLPTWGKLRVTVSLFPYYTYFFVLKLKICHYTFIMSLGEYQNTDVFIRFIGVLVFIYVMGSCGRKVIPVSFKLALVRDCLSFFYLRHDLLIFNNKPAMIVSFICQWGLDTYYN